MVAALFGDHPMNCNALATMESDGRAQRAGLLPTAATKEKFERAAGGVAAALSSLAIASKWSDKR